MLTSIACLMVLPYTRVFHSFTAVSKLYSTVLIYYILLYFIQGPLFLSRLNFHSCLYHCAPEKNISQYHSDSASNMPQLPAINQWVQTRVYKRKRYGIFLQDL